MAVAQGAPSRSFRPVEFEIDSEGHGFLLGSRCAACGAHFYPVREACAGCQHTDLTPVRFSTTGTLYTFAVVRQSTPDFPVPYSLGYVDLEEGVRIMSQLTGREPEDYQIGMKMELVVEEFGNDDDGNPLSGFRFQPVEES